MVDSQWLPTRQRELRGMVSRLGHLRERAFGGGGLFRRLDKVAAVDILKSWESVEINGQKGGCDEYS